MKPIKHALVDGASKLILEFSDETVRTDITELSYLVLMLDNGFAFQNWKDDAVPEEERMMAKACALTGLPIPTERTIENWMEVRKATFELYCQQVARFFVPLI